MSSTSGDARGGVTWQGSASAAAASPCVIAQQLVSLCWIFPLFYWNVLRCRQAVQDSGPFPGSQLVWRPRAPGLARPALLLWCCPPVCRHGGCACLTSASSALHQQWLQSTALQGRDCLSVEHALICRMPVLSLPELAQPCLHAQGEPAHVPLARGVLCSQMEG